MSSANPYFISPCHCKPLGFERFENNAVLNQSVIHQIQIESFGLWELLNKSECNPVEFDGIRNQTGLNRFALTPGANDKKERS